MNINFNNCTKEEIIAKAVIELGEYFNNLQTQRILTTDFKQDMLKKYPLLVTYIGIKRLYNIVTHILLKVKIKSNGYYYFIK